MIIGTTVETFEERRAELEHDSSLVDTFEHEDGSVTFILQDQFGEASNPREDDGNVATLIQENPRTIDIDSDVAGLAEAHEQFTGQPELMTRYLAMFRPDIAYYAEHWSTPAYGDNSYGWGYVTTAALEKQFPSELVGDRDAYLAEHGMTPESLFDSEVSVYGQWANGEVYGYVHLERGAEIVTDGPTSASVEHDGPLHEVEEDSCWGFLGYDSLTDIAREASSSPVV